TQYRLGVVQRKLGNRSRAVFMLERAAASYHPGSPQRRRAELEIQRIEFPVFPESGLDRKPAAGSKLPRYAPGEMVTWSGRLGRRYLAQHLLVEIEWCGPSGAVVRRERLHIGGGGVIGARLQTRPNSPPGSWSLRVHLVQAADSVVEERTFELT